MDLPFLSRGDTQSAWPVGRGFHVTLPQTKVEGQYGNDHSLVK